MASRTELFDLGSLSLASGEASRVEAAVRLDPFSFGGQDYVVEGEGAEVVLDVSRTTSEGYSLRLRLVAAVEGPCVRCLEVADQPMEVDAWEVDQPGGGEDLDSPYVDADELDLKGWARDALALALPVQILCRVDCRGLCPVCGENLNEAGPEHVHEQAPDPRWSKLGELKLD